LFVRAATGPSIFCRVGIGKTSYLKISDVIIVSEIHFATGHFFGNYLLKKKMERCSLLLFRTEFLTCISARTQLAAGRSPK
jgi:hypothetical protein